MGQISTPASPQSLILTATDRLVAANADGGLAIAAAHVVLLGESAGRNMGPLQYMYVIGASSAAGGMVNVGNNGSSIYGGLILSALTNAIGTTQGPDGPILAMGYNIAPALVNRVGNTQFIGDNQFASYPAGGLELFGNVFLGSQVQQFNRVLNANGGAASFNVMIGYRVARCAAAIATDGGGTVFGSNVFIGAEVAELGGFDGPVPGSVCFNNVFIGRQVARQVSNAQNTNAQANVFIGNAAGAAFTRGSENVAIGSGVAVGTVAFSDMTGLVLIGANITHNPVVAAQGNIIIGNGAIMSGMVSGNIFIGPQVNGDNAINAGSLHFLLSSNVGAAIRNLLYGKFSDATPGPGGLILGNSSNANRDIPGYNIFKILDGTITGVAPVGGGFFYGKAGAIHWVDPGNNDYDLTTGGTLGSFTVATLPAAPPALSRAFVTDALAPVFAAAVAGGGAVVSPVYFDGAAWLCG